MKNIFEVGFPKHKPVLIVGKGPTMDRIKEVDLSAYTTIALNHTCALFYPDYAHFIDLDAYLDCEHFLARTHTIIIMPFFPHIGEKPREGRSLEKVIKKEISLCRKSIEDKLLYYYLSTAPNPTDYPTVKVHHFSGEAIVRLLGLLGIKEIRTLGVDGGKEEASLFKHTRSRPPTYEPQMEWIHKTVKEFDINYKPLFRVGDSG